MKIKMFAVGFAVATLATLALTYIIYIGFMSAVQIVEPYLYRYELGRMDRIEITFKAVPIADSLLAQRNDLVWKIYGLESSYGKNDGCKRTGKFNGFGYGQHKSGWQCFDSFDEVVAKVHAWIEAKQLAGYTVPEILCMYNQGIRVSDCQYYQHYLTMK